ncbi:MAG: hypothetical protein JJE30_11165 [Desulfuromonadales bacterium]|nr:hypothetical protein [Desulfuromonadales bacterium]
MARINLVEKNELSLSSQSMNIKEQMEIKRGQEKTAINGNDAAKLEIAAELLMQGLSEEAVCRILNISADKLPEPV